MKHDDIDPLETQEWLDALESVLENEGEERAGYLIQRMGELASRSGTQLPYAITTPYRNTIPVTHEAQMPGDLFMERRIRSMVRWNALAMVMRTNQQDRIWVAIFPPSPPAPRCTISASTTSSRPPPKSTVVTWCTSRVTPHRVSMPAPSSKVASAKSR